MGRVGFHDGEGIGEVDGADDRETAVSLAKTLVCAQAFASVKLPTESTTPAQRSFCSGFSFCSTSLLSKIDSDLLFLLFVLSW